MSEKIRGGYQPDASSSPGNPPQGGSGIRCCGASPWISVEDRLPEVDRSVLICDDTKSMYVAMLWADRRTWDGGDFLSDTARCPHWMSLPPPPKER